MTKKELAAELRDRLSGTEDMAERLGRFSDEEIIGYYIRCSSCGKPAIPMDDLDLVIEAVLNDEEFILRLESLDESAPEKVHVKGCPEASSRQ